MQINAYPVHEMLRLAAETVTGFPKAAMFELRERGYDTIFEQLISCIISIRTLDETTIPVSLALFKRVRTPSALQELPEKELIELLDGTSFPAQKAATMRAVAALAVKNGGSLPADFDKLTALKGVGPKCANLALGVAAGIPAISVDSHVHRVVNRWGIVSTKSPEKTLPALEAVVNGEDWIDINRVLMPFGKFHCTFHLPACSVCPLTPWCKRVGVKRSK